MLMNEYCIGIAYATGYIASDNGKQYLVVRNLDPWYPKCIETESENLAYESKHNIVRDSKPQWVIKARNINNLPDIHDIINTRDFYRAYIEIHGVLDLATAKDRKGNHYKKPRLRVYGKEEILEHMISCLPAGRKKIQYITNTVSGGYKGKTCVVHYQSAREIDTILRWIDGYPRNERIWNKWNEIIELKGESLSVL